MFCGCRREQNQVTGPLAHSLRLGELSLKLGEGGGRVGADWLGPPSWSAQPLGGAVGRGPCSVPCFCSHLRSGRSSWVWSFCMLLIICHSCAHKQLFLIAYRFLVLKPFKYILFSYFWLCPGSSLLLGFSLVAVGGGSYSLAAVHKWRKNLSEII